MRLCRFTVTGGQPRIGLLEEYDNVRDLSHLGIFGLSEVLEKTSPRDFLQERFGDTPVLLLKDVKLLPPVEKQEVWAAGVTYLRSKAARMEESDFSASAYDKVYAADRPELFFKSMPEKVVGPGDAVGIRADAKWNVPEPELALVLNSRGTIVGCTIGNDMSSRDMEGENLLYLPQAKIYTRSCALGPCIKLIDSESEPRQWKICIGVTRQGTEVFGGSTGFDQMKRGLGELAAYLFRSQTFAHGAVLLTGTGVVPPDSFTLRPGDVITIRVDEIGVLTNTVVTV